MMKPPTFRVLNPGLGMSYQDQGRVGWRRYGVAPAGVMDSQSAQRANHLLENPQHAPVVEITMGGVSLECLEPGWLAWTGAGHCDALPQESARIVQAGEILHFEMDHQHCWAYLSVPGGWDCDCSLGSFSRHDRSNIGTAIVKGSVLRGKIPHSLAQFAGIRHRLLSPNTQSKIRLRLLKGPFFDHFSAKFLEKLAETAWQISSRSDRSGYRLEGQPLPLDECQVSVASFPTLPGSIQVPPSGLPLVTLNDGPTVGGYPVPAMIDPEDLPYFVQRLPHQEIRFTWKDEEVT